MGFFDKDMEEMLDVYLLETRQLLEQSDTILLEAERENRFSKENINGIFRVMHTIKSSSAMMGLSALSALAHRLEDLFDVFREDPSRLTGNESETFDLIFASTDFMKEELGEMESDSYAPRETENFFEKIDNLVKKVREQKKVTVNIRFEKNCKMENIRAYMVARQIRNLCSYMKTVPENVESDESTAEYIRQNGFYISFQAEEVEQVLMKLGTALFVAECTVVDEIPDKQTVKEEAAPKAEYDYINVRVERLDQLHNLVGELIIASSSLAASFNQQEHELGGKNHQLERLLKELEELVISIRMVPFSNVVPKMNRIVRDICKKEKKEVAFTVTGQEVEVDKKIADSILEPLIHLVRNAIDHGIELPGDREAAGKSGTGHVTLSFENIGGEILVSISDDGCGIDTESVREKAREKGILTKPEEDYSEEELLEICLLPGFSTRSRANEFSGRGVGLDVVRQMVESFGGHLHLESRRGEGSRFLLYLPLTLTIVEGIRFEVGNHSFAVPSHQVVQFLSHQTEEQELVCQDGKEYWVCEGRYVPVISLRNCYHMEEEAGEKSDIIAYVKGSTREACLVADRVAEQESLVEKPLPALLGPHFKRYTGISGCSLLGDGSICMLLDVEDLIRMAEGEAGYDKL